jgi:hypothetical protein
LKGKRKNNSKNNNKRPIISKSKLKMALSSDKFGLEKDNKDKKVTVVHSYEDRPKHLSDPLKHPDPNEIVPASKAPGLNLRKKLFFCGSSKCGHDIRDHKPISSGTPLSTGNTAGACKLCRCTGYRFTGKVDEEPIAVKISDSIVRKKKTKKFSKEHRTHMSEGKHPQIQLVKQAEIRDMLKRGKTFKEISDITHAGNKMIIEVKKTLPANTRNKLRKVHGGVKHKHKPKFKRRKMKPWMKKVGLGLNNKR